MSILEFAVKFFQDSGVAIYFSIAIMAIGLAIAIERYIFLNRARSQNRKLWAQVLPMLQNGRFKEVQGVTEKSDAAIGKIVANGLQRMQSPGRREDIDAAMEEGMMEIVPRLEKRTHYIATFANAWNYPGQELEWRMVSLAKYGSWYLLMLISFVLVTLVQSVRAPD